MFRTHRLKTLLAVAACLAALVCLTAPAGAEVCNVKIVTDANPDYNDIGSMIHSITDNWPATKDKCWAVWYWNHIARRQTAPMIVHDKELTDPIMQFNDYGYTMCSTVAGVNTSIFGAMGLNVRYWDITAHTVMDVEYDGAFHMFDSSLSAIYTICDGSRLAAVDEIGQDGSCEASGGKVEPGHIAKYHCLTGSSPNGFLTGCDTQRSLAEEYKCFTPKWLKYRYYLQFWDLGHRYILNLRDGEVYNRSYTRLDADSKNAVVQSEKRPKYLADPAYFVPNKGGHDPEGGRHGLRGNGVRTWTPPMTAAGLANNTISMTGVKFASGSVVPTQAGQAGAVVFKVEGANVIASMTIKPLIACKTADDSASIAVSTSNGLQWTEVWKSDSKADASAGINLIKEVSGTYEVLVKVQLIAKANPADAQLKGISFDTITQINAKTQPRLNIGKNQVYVGAGEQTESIVVWPDLHGDKWKPYVVDMQNVKISDDPKDWMGTMQTAEDGKPGYVTFQIDAPNDITDFVYGGRYYNRERKPKIEAMHSFDGGKTWITSYTLTETTSPWDTIHHEKITNVPPGTKSVQFKYVLDCSKAGTMVCSFYGLRMEVHHKVADSAFKPMEVTFAWKERQEDYSTVSRSHTQLVEKLPFTYDINVGGADHPVMESLKVNFKGAAATQPVKYGYSDGNENAGAKKFSDRWVTYGKILSTGKPYTCTEQPAPNNNGAGDPDGKRLTDGVVGSTYVDGISYKYAVSYEPKQKPEITVDLGKLEKCGAFRIQLGGYPAWDALKGQIKDKVEVFTSKDGKEFTSQGFFNFNLRWKDLAANYMWPDDEALAGFNHELILKAPVDAQYVKFAVTPVRGGLTISEVQVLESIKYDAFDLKLAPPDGKDRSDVSQYNPKHVPSGPYKANKPSSAPAAD